jgi:membrane protein YdbS with pleckstrin-like domain
VSDIAAAADDWQRQDPRKIDLDRAVGWITTAVVAFGLFIGLTVTSSWFWLPVMLLVVWLPVTIGVAALSYLWPPHEYRRTRYRIDDEVVEIERGVWWRSSITVPRPRVQHLDVSQGPLQRHYGLGVLSIYTAGTEHSVVALPGLAHEVALALRDRLLPRDARVDGV